MAVTSALDAGDITKVGLVVIVGLVLLGALLSVIITKLLGRLLILALVVVLGVLVWTQRNAVQKAFSDRACHLDKTFFGVHLDPPDSVKQACRGTAR